MKIGQMEQRATFIDQDDYTEVMFPYDKVIVEAFKAEIPWESRWWKPEVKAWAVDISYVDVAVKFFLNRGYDVLETVPRYPRQPKKQYRGLSSYAVLCLTDDAPDEVVKAVYRALARLHHPDVGGDEETMKAINKAYREITS